MQNDSPSSSTSRRRDAIQRRLQENPQSNEEIGSEAGVPHRSSSVRSRRQRDRGAESPGNGESGPELHSSQPPALEYYRNDEECVSGEDTDADEMAEEEEHYSGGEEGAPADKSNAEGLSDISDSEEEEGELDDSLELQESSGGSSSRKSKHTSAPDNNTKHHGLQKQHQDQSAGSSSSSRYHQGRKRLRHAQQQEEGEQDQELDCSSEQYAVEVKRLRESKLKHNKNEQMRRKDMKEAVHRLRNQLRRKTKKPSTISVLKAAKQEIDELTAIKVEEEKELERLRQRELFLKYQLESFVSDHNKRLSSGSSAGVLVSPGVVGPTPGSFLHPSPTAVAAPTNPPPPPLPPSLHSRPGLPHAQFSGLFLPPPPPAAVSRSTTVAGVGTSPTAIRRVGLIDSPQHAVAAAHASIITPTGLSPITRLPLPQPPSLIPFTAAAAAANLNPSTPPSIGGGSSTSPAARTPGAAISIFPAAPPGSAIIPGITPLHLLPPRTTTAATAQPLYASFPSSLIMPYGRHPSPTTPVVGAGLTATHPAVGRLAMAPTFPYSFSFLPTALRPPTTALGVAGFGHYGTAAPASQSSTRHVQIVSAESPRTHRNGRSRCSSGDSGRNTQTTDDSEAHHSSSTDSKNGVVSAETYSPRTHSPSKVTGNTSVREVSADSRHVAGSTIDSGVYRAMATESRDSEGYRLKATKRQRSSDGNVDDDDSYSNSRTTATEKRPRVIDRYSRNHGIISVEKNPSKKYLLSTAPPLLKMIDSDTDYDMTGERWSEDRQQFVRERDRDQYQHLSTLPPPPALRNAEVISTVIKHMQPRGEIVSSSMVTGLGYGDHEKNLECHNGLEDFRCRGGGGGEQRSRMSNSLSSSDEGPDSPLSQQKFNGSEQSTYSCNKMLGRDGIYVRKHSSLSDGVSYKNSQYKSLRKKKNNLHRPNNNNYSHHTIMFQSTT